MDERNIREDEIDLLDLARKLLRYWLVFILAAIIGGGGALSYSMFMITPQYQAECMVYVNNGSISLGASSITVGDLDASQDLVDTYMVILKSRRVLNDVAKRANVDYTYEQMKQMVSAGKVNNTEVFSIYVTSSDPKEAEKIANTIAEILPKAIADIVEGSSVKIVDYAVVPSQKISPSNSKNGMMGAIGLLALVGVILTMKILLDKTIQSDEDLFELTRYPLLSKVPEIGDSGKKRRKKNKKKGKHSKVANDKAVNYIGDRMPFANKEAYRLLKTNLVYSIPSDGTGKIVGITSSVASEYKTTTAINLAIKLAEDGDKKVLLLDCDLRMSEIAERLGLDNRMGLTEYLTGDADLKGIIQHSEEYPHLFTIVGGNSSPNPGKLLRSQKMKDSFKGLAKVFDYIIVDFPPANIVSDALELGKECDGMIVVVRQDFTEKQVFEEAMSKIQFVGINVLGLVLTGVDKGYGSKYNYVRYYGNYKEVEE